MSAVNQNQSNGKKSGSSSNSAVNTPAPTPVSNANVQAQSSPPPNNNAPKYGTLVPNRVFVGGISANTTEGELLQLFSQYGTVKAAKIIQDRAGVSKGYGFITFESEDDAKRLQRESDSIILRERKLNIAPAIKKQPFSRAFDASTPPTVAAGNPPYYFQPGTAVPFFQGGVAYYPQPTAAPSDPAAPQPTAAVYQPPPVYPAHSAPPQTAAYPSMMFQPPIYMPQQYPMPMPYEYNYYASNGGPHYVMGNQNGPQPQGPPMQPPGSPPRTSCYNQQLPYNTDPALYYNIPMYGSMDGPPIYQDPLDLANSNAYVEEPYALVDGSHFAPHQQDLEQQQQPSSLHHHDFTRTTQSRDTTSENDAIATTTRQTDNITTTTRQTNTNTPVASFVAPDQRREKDFGRRKKPFVEFQPQPPPPFRSHFPAIVNGAGYMNNVFPMNFPGYGPQFRPMAYATAAAAQSHYEYSYGHGGRSASGGGNNNWSRRRRANAENRSLETSSRSSVRSDSNSSASAVDENRNENDKIHRTDITSPPPAPYSPITHYGYPTGYNAAKNNHEVTHKSRDSNNGKKTFSKVVVNSRDGDAKDDRNSDQFVVPKQMNSGGAMPTGTGGGGGSISQQQQQQHFAPPLRGPRNRRSTVRRGTALSEIGAGDAPLPTAAADVSDACKKLDSLKL